MDFDQNLLDRSNQWGRMLAIMHYVLGAFVVLFSALPGVYILFGVMLVSGNFPTNPGAPTPPGMGVAFVVLGAVLMLLLLAVGIGNIAAGVWIHKRKGWTAVLIVSCVNLLNQPLGMLLGIFSLLWLMRPDVRESFARDVGEGLDNY